jgi:glycolate oxidase iron-sulfur subunit
MEICEFLATQGYKPRGHTEPVTYHDPCHLRFAQHIEDEPRRLLSAVAEVREPSEPGRCCGGGGTFSIFHYDLSREIGTVKAKILNETGATTVATACPGCMIQLSDMLGKEMEVCHVVDIIARADHEINCAGREDFVAAGTGSSTS